MCLKVVIAMDSFKGSISSTEANKAVSIGIRNVYPEAEIISIPLADGGEGTVEALIQATNGMHVIKEVMGPLGQKVLATYGILPDKTAVIEIAEACGLPLVEPDKRNPTLTTTYGVGELIQSAIEKGCRQFVIGLGGSSTNDAGVGMLQALGFRFFDANNNEVGFGGQVLSHIKRIDLTNVIPELKNCAFKIACDVSNPLYGSNGAAYIYGPQKGANTEMIIELDKGLQNFAHIVQRDLNIDIATIPGSGAAGGLGAAFFGLLKGSLESGIQLVLETVKIQDKIQGANFIITGEGRVDAQSKMGKTLSGIGQLGIEHHIPVIALVGSVHQNLNELSIPGVTACFSIVNEPMSITTAMARDIAVKNLQLTSAQVFKVINVIGKRNCNLVF